MTGRLRYPDISRHRGVEDFFPQVMTDIRLNALAQVIATIDHGHQDTEQVERCIQCALDPFDGLQQMRQSFKRIEFGLQRHQHLIRGHKAIDRQKSKSRGTIDQNELIFLAQRRQQALQPALCFLCLGQLNLSGGQRLGGR